MRASRPVAIAAPHVVRDMAEHSPSEFARLRDRVAKLERELQAVKKSEFSRERISQMSADVVDTNPYR